MASVNKVIIVGNLGRDPEVRYTPNGGAGLQRQRSPPRAAGRTRTRGDKAEETEWHRVVFYDKLAEIAGEYLKKGRSVYVEGRLKTRKWQDKDGVEKYTTEIIASDMQMLGSREGMGGGAGGDDATAAAVAAAATSARRRRAPAPARGEPAGREVVDRLRRHGRRHSVLIVAAPSGAALVVSVALQSRPAERATSSVETGARAVAPRGAQEA